MDISPPLLREVEFREKWRGYSPDEVDRFLEKVAAGVEQLEAKLQETDERATRAERRVLETSDDDVRRALVLAQRTAEAALAEAKEEADRRVAAAEEQARAVRVDAEERAAAELRELAARRAELEADVSALANYVREHRARLADELRGQLEWLKAPGRLALPEPPVATAEPAPAGPIRLPGADDDGGPPTQGMPIDLVALEAEQDESSPVMVNRTVDVREVRSRHAALDSAAEGDPFLAELRRAMVDDDDGDAGSALEGPDLVDADIVPERRGLRRRKP